MFAISALRSLRSRVVVWRFNRDNCGRVYARRGEPVGRAAAAEAITAANPGPR